MLIKQALSEALQLVASQLFPLHAVVLACFRLLRKIEKSWRWMTGATIGRDRCDRRRDSLRERKSGTMFV
jgi:hypothetical protein